MKTKTLDDIYKKYILDIYRYLYSLCHDHHLAEDITQETFFRAYMFLEDCEGRNVRMWLYKVAFNAFVDYKRKNKNLFLEDDFSEWRVKDVHGPDMVLVRKEQLQDMFRLISNLPENQRKAILLHDFHGLGYKEAAEIMKVSLANFKILLFRARRKLRLKQRGDECE